MSMNRPHINSTPIPLPNGIRDTLFVNGYHGHARRSTTPIGRPIPANAARLMNSIEGDLGVEEDPRLAVFRGLYAKSEARLNSLFDQKEGDHSRKRKRADEQADGGNEGVAEEVLSQAGPSTQKSARKIDEDDYDESDEEEDDDASNASPLKSKSTMPAANLALSSSAMLREISASSTLANVKGVGPSAAGKTTEEALKRLEEDKKAIEEAAKRSFNTMFYTLENDKKAMLDQKKLEDTERQIDVEMGQGNEGNGAVGGQAQHGTLSQSNLGASSLTLKNLIRQIDSNRTLVAASDSELRALMLEVRKNRSKWANEDKIGQEELYEAVEKVLNELRAMTEHSGPFLLRVNKKEAPDYYNVIKHPMDLGQMQKNLKSGKYQSKQDFVNDLNLIWSNCLKYNANPDHFLRKKALVMRKETEKLVPLIPDIIIRDRAEVEAEERRRNNHTLVDDDEDSDDEPIISSRGRKAPGKTSKKGTTARKAPAGPANGSPAPTSEVKQSHHLVNGLGSNLRNETLLRADSEGNMDGSQKDASTPPQGTITPAGVSGLLGQGSGTDAMDIDGESSINGMIPSVDGPHDETENEDLEYKTWKQVTNKDRALVTAERHALFMGDRLDPEQPALRRTKKGMWRWLRNQKQAVSDGGVNKSAEAETTEVEESQPGGETLAEGMEGTEERVLPDYYDTMSAIPEVAENLRWVEDSEGNVVDPSEEFLRIIPKGFFTSRESNLTRKIDENLRQVQNTRKIASKIGVVKQMQQQSQMYQGQFQKHEPAPFVEQDIEPTIITDEGPPTAPWVSRAALQRSTAKLLVHAGFEEYQPAALDAITDLASDYFAKLVRTVNEFLKAPQQAISVAGSSKVTFKERYTDEEKILHSLQENGVDLEGLDSYVTEDVERAGTRIAMTHDRMKVHLADSLRPALVDAGPDGANAFNDNSEQFLSGDFAEELGEDFFGFKELGLDLGSSVPLHLLQNRMRNANQSQNPDALTSTPLSSLPAPSPLTPITIDTVHRQIGLIQTFFLNKLAANSNEPLIEDDDLPQKQRFPKPRLPPTGKITSPRKRPQKEGPGKGHPRKKMKLDDGGEAGKEGEAAKEGEGRKERDEVTGGGKGAGKPSMNGVAAPTINGDANTGGGDANHGTPISKSKRKESEVGMPSPESLEAT